MGVFRMNKITDNQLKKMSCVAKCKAMKDIINKNKTYKGD